MKKFLVTGGAGFIGSHLVDQLIKEENKVIILDDLSAGTKENLISSDPLIEFFHGSILNHELVYKLCDQVDGIFHLAAHTSVQKSIVEPFLSHQVNTLGTLNILEAARKKQTKVVYASSAAYYGDVEKLPCREIDPSRPLSPYAAQKILGENYCQTYYDIHHLPSMILRFFNVYGPRQIINVGYAGVVKLFMDKLKNKKPLIIYGDGSQSRDFIYVEDVVQACILAMESDLFFGIYNIGTGIETDINQIASLILELTKSDNTVEHTSQNLSGDVPRSRACTQKAERELHFKSSFSMREGLSHTLKDMNLF